MAQLVHAGYKGLLVLGGNNIRFADGSIAAKQEVNAPEMIMGDWDYDLFNYGKIEVGGSLSGPVDESFSDSNGILTWACQRDACGLLTPKSGDIYYYCGTGLNKQALTDLYVNSLEFSCSAGEVAQWSLDVMGKSAGTLTNATPTAYTDTKKLLTWDKVTLSLTNEAGEDMESGANGLAYQQFSFNISNQLEAVYSLSQANLFPYDIVPGLRKITGSITAYNIPEFLGHDTWDDYSGSNNSQISFNINGTTLTAYVKFFRVQPKSSTGVITSTVGFVGVGHQTGAPWVPVGP